MRLWQIFAFDWNSPKHLNNRGGRELKRQSHAADIVVWLILSGLVIGIGIFINN